MAYALYNLSAANDPSDSNRATGNRKALADEMDGRQIEAAQELTRRMAQGKPMKVLDAWLKTAGTQQSARKSAQTGEAPPQGNAGPFPARPAKRPGVVSCNTRCNNGDCYRTYDNGRQIHFQAKPKFNPFNNQMEWDSGSC
ncbi:hypothetical protein [Rhodocyclus gracilis]|uniref:Uncharacterized protein n=1 Tax=Rhodocyclus tenuis TaxID=1066 RepID=A0A6L5JVC3_RHOTE|nr:hypothetical protein [Rhodocyclus gracilis]MQY51315.1 hypothetical protein [Rhodocyclus gracilis]